MKIYKTVIVNNEVCTLVIEVSSDIDLNKLFASLIREYKKLSEEHSKISNQQCDYFLATDKRHEIIEDFRQRLEINKLARKDLVLSIAETGKNLDIEKFAESSADNYYLYVSYKYHFVEIENLFK